MADAKFRIQFADDGGDVVSTTLVDTDYSLTEALDFAAVLSRSIRDASSCHVTTTDNDVVEKIECIVAGVSIVTFERRKDRQHDTICPSGTSCTREGQPEILGGADQPGRQAPVVDGTLCHQGDPRPAGEEHGQRAQHRHGGLHRLNGPAAHRDAMATTWAVAFAIAGVIYASAWAAIAIAGVAVHKIYRKVRKR